jgi:chromosome segregation ATPase
LKGHFEYTPLGLLDRTHLRFFDRSGAEQLIADGGLVISERLRVSRGLEETEIAVAKDEIPPSLAEILAHDPDSTTYQFIFVARRAADERSTTDGAMLSERLQRENEALREQLSALEQYARNLDADRAAAAATTAERDELREELRRRMAEAHDLQRDLRHCKSEVTVKEAFIMDLRADDLTAQGVIADLTAQRDSLLSRQRELEASLNALTTYANAASFRLVEKAIVQLKRVPGVSGPARAIVRMAGGRRDGHS